MEVRAARLTGVVGLSPAVSGYPCSAPAPLDVSVTGTTAEIACRGQGADGGPVRGAALMLLDSDVEPAGGQVAGGGATILGPHSALPVLGWAPLPVNTLQILWLSGLDEPVESLRAVAETLEWAWTADGVEVRHGGQTTVMPWQRKTPWAADAINQGVFRWGAART
jgi:hypothetical protein